MSNITKEQMISAIEAIQKNPNDKVRILGDISIAGIGVTGGVAAAGTLATIGGATAIPLLTSGASFLGITAVAATPVGWVIGAAALGGALTYGVSRLIKNGSQVEGQKKEVLVRLKEMLARKIQETDKKDILENNELYNIIKELVKNDILPVDTAQRLIAGIESKSIQLEMAYELLLGIIQDMGSFYLLAPLAIKVSAIDGHIHDLELATIEHFFVTQFDHDENTIRQSLQTIKDDVEKMSLDQVIEKTSLLVRALNVNASNIKNNIFVLLEDIVNADSVVSQSEINLINEIKVKLLN